MKKLLLKHWRKFLIIIFAAIVIITLVFNSMLIRSTTYAVSYTHLLPRIRDQIAPSASAGLNPEFLFLRRSAESQRQA